MNKQQVVVVTGKPFSGKSSLASLLEKIFYFKVIRKGELSNNKKIVNNAKKFLTNQPGTSIVVDCLKNLDQVTEFRKEFGESLIHVHLYASTDTLHKRYSESVKDNSDAPQYDEIDDLKLDSEIVALKNDADVRIFTTRADPRDTLSRVAARLHLFAPPDVRCVDVLIGGQYGSEGKGNVVSYLAREYDVLVRVGGPNAGHTVASTRGPYTYHHLPSGSRDVRARLLLGPGMTIRVDKLLQEIKDCNIGPDRLFIDPQAMIIEDEDTNTEKNGHLVKTIASTGSGSGAASARRILNRGKENIRCARDIPELEPFVGTTGNYHGTTADRLEEAYRKRQSVLLEGTQGSGLSIFHGQYPHVTSRDTNVSGCLAEAGISPRRVRKVLMVVRPMPIRVGDPEGYDGHTSGHLKHPTTFDEIALNAGLDGDALNKAEKTSTTKRNRKVGWFEWEQYRSACALNAPTDIVLTFADYLKASNSKARRFEQLDSETIKFIEELERIAQAPVSLINTRFPRENDGTSDLRSLIDRRNWTANSPSE